ncbi:hypothetical protein C5S30_06035 [ANME-1 cluster archaeon GoMg4]|nr:hypothetical protein [ANME-1 cluster archaeon GoMg4]
MTVIGDLVRPREEVLTEGIEGRVDVYKALRKEGIEGDSKKFLDVTYLTKPLKEVFDELADKLNNKKGSKGVYIFSGGFGSGKSHHILALYHALSSPEICVNWLNFHNYSFTMPTKIKSVLIHALNMDPDYLWEPIFEDLGRGDILTKVKRFPTHEHIKEAIGDNSVIIFLDEVESWFNSLNDEKLEDRNLNFLQNLLEIAADSDSNLIVFISLLEEIEEIKGRINRQNSYWCNLYGIEDRDRVVLYRLFHLEDKERNENAIQEIIGKYISAYKQSGLFKDQSVETRKRIEDLKNRMFNSYPFHPQLMETLFEKYGASTTYQKTRGILYLLSTVVRDYHDKKDLILLSDINPKAYDELAKLDRELSEKAIEDIRKMESTNIKHVAYLLSTVFIKSIGFGPTRGASKEDILFGVLSPAVNVNEIDASLTELSNSAPHLWLAEGKYFIRPEVNVLVLIENEARMLKDKYNVAEKIAGIIKDEIKIEKIPVYCYDTDGVDTKNQTKILFSLKEIGKDNLKEIFEEQTFQNRIIFINPICKDVLRSNGINMNVARVLAIDEMKPQFERYKAKLEHQRSLNISEIKKKLKEKYGKMIRWQDSSAFMPVSVDFDSGKIQKKLEEEFDISSFKEKILFLVDKREEGETLSVGEIRNQFYRTRSFPVVIDEDIFRKTLNALINDAKIVVVSGSDVFRKGRVLPFLRDDYVVMKPEEVPEEAGGVEVGERVGIRMRVPGEETLAEEEKKEALREDEVVTPPSEGGEIEYETFKIEESTPWSLQGRLGNTLDESVDVGEVSVTMKGRLKGKDVKGIVDNILEEHEDNLRTMKLDSKVRKK